MISDDANHIRFRASARIKDNDMIVLKMLTNPEYSDIDAIKDIYGKRNECKNKDDALLLMQYHWISVFKRDPNVEIKIKNLFGKTVEESNEYIESMKAYMDPEFYTLLIEKAKGDKSRKNANKYEDAKMIGVLTDNNDINHTVEIQFNLLNNKNESSFAHHRIYKMKAIIDAITRLQGYIRKAQIDHIIEVMLEEHKEIAQKELLFPELLYL